MLINENLSLQEKLAILSDAAKYDVACTSSGIDRKGAAGSIGNTSACGICHSFSADGRCISLLKILMTNECIYDCRYCINRSSNDTLRTAFTPEEICQLVMGFYKRNYIEGLFLSSGIQHDPNTTMEQILKTLFLLREKYRFRGYIHVKAIPGASEELIAAAGHLADRMSVNLELPTASGLKALAPCKTRHNILQPMRQIQRGILRKEAMSKETRIETSKHLQEASGIQALSSVYEDSASELKDIEQQGIRHDETPDIWIPEKIESPVRPVRFMEKSSFVPAGQSTQMIIGATPETDYQILSVTQALYQKFQMKRVFFSAYTALNEDAALPAPGTPVPMLREHRLYQADWLLRYYGFHADEILNEANPFFNPNLDPKCDWAIHHPEFFPVEINKADYQTLLRIPGVGVRSARRILKARRYTDLDFNDLKKLGIVLKRARYFITCRGRLSEDFCPEWTLLEQRLTGTDPSDLSQSGYRQLSLFDSYPLGMSGS